MTPQDVGIGLFAGGVAGFFAGLFGLVGGQSIYIAAFGAVLAASGLIVLAYESFGLAAGGPSLGFFLWGIVPYLLCLVVAASAKSAVPAFAGAIVALLFDLLAHYQVFLRPTNSTAGLTLLFTPLWNTLVFSPLPILATWLIRRRRDQLNATAR